MALRSKRLFRFAIWGGAAILAMAFAIGARTPIDSLKVNGTVRYSLVGFDSDGMAFHQLEAKLDDGTIVSVRTLSREAMRVGRPLTLLRRRSWLGWASYNVVEEQDHR